MHGTTVAQMLNQGSIPPLGGFKRRGPFLGTFLGKQKGTKRLKADFLIKFKRYDAKC
jgi:hypothetical protein